MSLCNSTMIQIILDSQTQSKGGRGEQEMVPLHLGKKWWLGGRAGEGLEAGH